MQNDIPQKWPHAAQTTYNLPYESGTETNSGGAVRIISPKNKYPNPINAIVISGMLCNPRTDPMMQKLITYLLIYGCNVFVITSDYMTVTKRPSGDITPFSFNEFKTIISLGMQKLPEISGHYNINLGDARNCVFAHSAGAAATEIALKNFAKKQNTPFDIRDIVHFAPYLGQHKFNDAVNQIKAKVGDDKTKYARYVSLFARKNRLTLPQVEFINELENASRKLTPDTIAHKSEIQRMIIGAAEDQQVNPTDLFNFANKCGIPFLQVPVTHTFSEATNKRMLARIITSGILGFLNGPERHRVR